MGMTMGQTRHGRRCALGLTAWAVFAAGCTTTAVDVIVTAQDAPPGLDAATGAVPDAQVDAQVDARADAQAEHDACIPMPAPAGPGMFRIRGVGVSDCLVAGEPTTVRGVPARQVAMERCVTEGAAPWTLIPDGQGAFELRHTRTALNLDIETASVVDGTRAILFNPHQLGNQRFVFQRRSSRVYEIRPVHAADRCLSRAGGIAAIWPCERDDPDQVWELRTDGCP
jgi:hypothetical protein